MRTQPSASSCSRLRLVLSKIVLASKNNPRTELGFVCVLSALQPSVGSAPARARAPHFFTLGMDTVTRHIPGTVPGGGTQIWLKTRIPGQTQERPQVHNLRDGPLGRANFLTLLRRMRNKHCVGASKIEPISQRGQPTRPAGLPPVGGASRSRAARANGT